MDTPANTSMAGGVATHVSKYGAVTTISCQLTDGTAATSGNVATPLRKVKMDVVRTFTTDTAGLQSGNVTMATSEIGLTDATGAVSFTITGPANPNTAVGDVYNDVVVLSDLTGGAINDGAVLDSYSGNMDDSGSNMTFTLNYLDTAVIATTSGLTSTATSGLANAVTGITRTYTGTVYDQYGDTVASNAGTFASSSTLPGGLACTVATPSVCTTLAVHGLAVGDDVIFTGMGAGVLSTGDSGTNAVVNAAAAGTTPTTGSSWTVQTVPSTTTFTLWDGTTSLRGLTIAGAAGTASTDVSPITAVATSTATAARTTSTDGTASYSWTDTEGTSGLDTITWTPTTATASTKKFYRLAAASDFTSTDADGDDATDSETYAKLVEWDGTNDDFILEITDDTDASNSVLSYRQYTFDDNDHFATAGTSGALNGTPATKAAWETAMATAALVTGGTANDVVYVDYGTGLATDINRFTADAG